MNPARVFSVEALQEFKAALAVYIEDSRSALSMIEIELRRGVDWVTRDRSAHWQNESRRRWDAVNRAKENLAHARTFKAMDGYTPACTEEKKELAKSENRFREAERRMQATKHWCREILHEVTEFEARLSQMTSLLDAELPKGIAALEKMIRALDSYLALEAPDLGVTLAESTASAANPVGSSAETVAERKPAPAASETAAATDPQPAQTPASDTAAQQPASEVAANPS